MIQVDSLSERPSEFSRDGIAENNAELLKASRNCAKQNTMRSRYRLKGENRCGTLPSTRVWAGDSTLDLVVGGAIMSTI